MLNRITQNKFCLPYYLWPEMVEELRNLHSWWFNMLTKSKRQESEQVVHISWERGSIYFDTVKICCFGADDKAEQGAAGLALSRVVNVL